MSLPITPLSEHSSRRPCSKWEGRPSEYQFAAREILKERLALRGWDAPWTYIVPQCPTKLCLQKAHLRMFRSQKIAYPTGVCVYCGLPGFTKDHLLPVTMTGEAARKFVAVVPACGECNSAIGDRCGHRITERREEAHRHIRKKYRKLLHMGDVWSEDELRKLGPNLRSHIKKAATRREVVLARLDWPWDPEYDKRAFQKSGFEDPIGMELL